MISGVFGLTGAGKSSFLAWCASRAQRGKRLHIGLSAAGGVWLQDESSKAYDRIYSNFPLKGYAHTVKSICAEKSGKKHPHLPAVLLFLCFEFVSVRLTISPFVGER